MSNSGTYIYEKGKGLVKISSAIPNVCPLSAWMPKGDIPYYDKSAKRKFESRTEKRSWMKQYGLKEGGIINPDKRLDFNSKNRGKPSLEQRTRREQMRSYIQSQGGTLGLLEKTRRG